MKRGRRLWLFLQMQVQPGFSGCFVSGAYDGYGFLFRNICPNFFCPVSGFLGFGFRFCKRFAGRFFFRKMQF